MNFLKTVVSLGLGGSSCHGRPVVHPFFPAPSPLFAVCIRRTPSARQAALAQADQAAHGLAARAPDMGVVRCSFDTTTLARPADQGDRLAPELHAALYAVCVTSPAHELGL